MAGYGIIADVSEAIVRLLREKTVPDLITNTESIGMCHPSDKGDIVLGINLYDIKTNETVVATDKTAVGTAQQRFPSSYYDLYYMITAYSASDIKFRSIEEAKILGRVLQILKDAPLLRPDTPDSGLAGLSYTPKIELLDLENEEKVRLWNIPDVPYKLSLFYKVYPVEIESQRIREVQRVTSADFTIRETEKKE